MATIQNISAKEIKDSRSQPTVEVILKTEDGEFADSVPAGKSLGATEAKTVPVRQAIDTIERVITPKLLGMNPVEQTNIDALMRELDGTADVSKLGANAILPISLACARAAAASQHLELHQWLANLSGIPTRIPTPMMVMISGGEHGMGNGVHIQEFMVIGPTAEGARVWETLGDYFNQERIPWVLGPEGSFAPKMVDDNQAIDLLNRFRGPLSLALDAAASHRKNVVDMVNWIDKYPLASIEDPFDQEAWSVWSKFTADFGSRVMVVGDDLFTTNPVRVQRGINEKSANAIIVKPNQIGTLTDVFKVCRLAHQAGWTRIVSHRSGETMDDFIADLAVAVGAQFLKSGAPQPSERKVKYDRLEKIGRA